MTSTRSLAGAKLVCDRDCRTGAEGRDPLKGAHEDGSPEQFLQIEIPPSVGGSVGT